MKKSKNFIYGIAGFLFCLTPLEAQNASSLPSSAASNDAVSAVTASISEQESIVKETNRGPTALTPSPQMAMSSPDYPVTAGDVYTLAFAAGSIPVTYTISVDSTYRIRVANLAVLSVAGKTFLQLKREVEEIVTKNYPMSGVQFVLLTPAVFKVTIKGEVKQTEVRQAWALTRLSSVIDGTLTDYASTRNITVTSSSGTKHTYDLFQATRQGDMSQNPYIRPDDTITIARFKRRVTVTGAVERPGTYELLDGENLQKLVDFYGNGLTERADTSRIELTRIQNRTETSGEKIYLDQQSIMSNYQLSNYDAVKIPFLQDIKPVMFIEGALNSGQRIPVSFTAGETYVSLIQREKSQFSATADQQSAYIVRDDKTIPIDVSRVLHDASFRPDETVQAGDTLKIPFRQSLVSNTGAATAASAGSTETTEKTADTGATGLQLSAQLAMSSPDYPITAGDVYMLSFVAGATNVTYEIPVDITYKIRVANLGILDTNGKTFPELKKEVVDLVTKNYAIGDVQFVLQTPGVFKVTVKGEVTQTTIKQAWGLTRLSSVISGTTTGYSSVRNITVTAASGDTQSYDLFSAQRNGDLSQDPYVRPGDTITIGRFTRKVTVNGAVERPGTYELLDGENLKTLINYYGGGLVDRADTSRMELTRTLNQTSPSGIKLYLKQDSINSDYTLLCYDTITIPLYLDLKPVMFMEGALYASEGTAPEGSTRVAVTFTTAENYGPLVREHRKMFSAVSDTQNAYIIRNGKIIPLDMNRILYDASYYTTETVQPDDTLMVPFRQFFVTVSGAVETPGRYPYIPDRNWTYYIGLAGGFSADKNSHEAVTITDINGKRHNKKDPITPETNILALNNSFTYYFSKYSPVITTLLSSISTALTIYAVTR